MAYLVTPKLRTMLKRLIPAVFILLSLSVNAQKKITEATVAYDITVSSKDGKPTAFDFMNGATSTIYFKGSSYCQEQVFSDGTIRTIFDGNTQSSVVLKEVNGNKTRSENNAESLKNKDARYESVVFTPDPETRTIAGYLCKKLTATMPSGMILTIYYTPDLMPGANNYEPYLKKTPGLALRYSMESKNYTIYYQASLVKLAPVPAEKFKVD
jgi:GLPGLI family protein